MRRVTALSLGAAIACSAVASVTSVARAQEAQTCNVQDSVPVSNGAEFPYRAPRYREVWVRTGVVGDWYLHPSYLLGLGFDVRPATERFRFGPGLSLVLAKAGDVRRGAVAVQPDLGARYSPYVDEFVDVYGLLGAGLPVSFPVGADASVTRVDLRPYAGVGVRILRAVSLEATAQPLVALGARFDDRARALFGYGLLVGFDVCSLGGCSPPEVVPDDVDDTCDLYARAERTCEDVARGPKANERRAALCDAVYAALDPIAHPPDPADPSGTFLAALAPDPRLDEALRAELSTLYAIHVDRWRRWSASVACGKELGGEVPARLPRVRVNYAPYPGDLRQLLGCDVERPTCAPYARCASSGRGG